MHRLLFVLLFLPLMAQAQEPANANWKALLGISYLPGSEGGLAAELPHPIFTADVKAMEGQEIELTGFIIPFDGLFSPDHVILSFMPVEICYFCGQSGPETVVEVFLEEPVEYTNKPVKVRGRLVLHEEPLETLIYVLEEAEFLGEYKPKS